MTVKVLRTDPAAQMPVYAHPGDAGMDVRSIEGMTLAPGARADIVLFDPEESFTVDPAKFRSKGRSTPFAGMTLRGAVKATYLAGRLVYKV